MSWDGTSRENFHSRTATRWARHDPLGQLGYCPRMLVTRILPHHGVARSVSARTIASEDAPTGHDGMIVNTWRGNGIAVTHDGGRTWNDATLALPSGALAAPSVFGQPVFVTGGSGFVVVDFQADTGSVFLAYRTSDAGSSWTQAAALPSGVSTVAFLDAQRWVGSDGAGMVTTHDGGLTWVRSPAVGLPAAPALLQMANSQLGWALVWMSVCLDSKSNCSSRTGLYATGDAGSTWTQLWPG